jgi:hypothetical protein
MHTMIRQVCQRALSPHLDIPAPLFHKGIGPEWRTDPDLRVLISKDYICFGFPDFPSALKADICVENVNSVLLIMDPRDALVSEYFSFKLGGVSGITQGEHREIYCSG